MKAYRTNGAVGALLDEYEKAVGELIHTIHDISAKELTTIADPETDDADCRSIQSILTHVVKAGYSYVVAIRRHQGEEIDFPERVNLDSIGAYQKALKDMFQFNEQLFDQIPNLKLEEYEEQKKILTSWGQRFDVEQLFEHAIVHVLRHRRQIERFLEKMR